MDRKTNVKRGLISGVINNVLTLILPFVSRTVIIYYLGSAYLGLGGVFNAIVNILNISELGFASAMSFILYRPIAENDSDRVCAILSFSKNCFRIIGVIVLVLGLLFLPFLKKVVNADIPPEINIYVLYGIFLLNSIVSYFLFAYKRVLLSAAQRYDLETAIASIVLILQYVAQIIILIVSRNYYLFIGMTIVSSLLSNILCEIVSRKHFSGFFCKGVLPKQEVSEVVRIVKGVFATKLGATINSSIDNVVISTLFGLVILGKYSNYYYIITVFVSLFAVIHNSLRPTLGNCIITDTKQQMYDRLESISLIYTWGATLLSVVFLCIAQDFILVWAGEDYVLPYSYVIALFFLFYFGRLFCVPTVFVEAAGLWYESKYINLIAVGLNVVLSFTFAQFMGVIGIPIASTLVSLLANMGYLKSLFKYYFKGENGKKYILTVVKNMFFQLFMAIGVFYATRYIEVDSLLSLVFKALAVFLLSLLFMLVCGTFYWRRLQNVWPFLRALVKR